ncbi:MAG: FecR domain-containing protein [Mediterranea sp.]|jgi:ferric-dicitrate binding protein FerR (iron transport regulator)|nr:FecR domain-containing protein [Mediterranea sp.]
MESKDDILNRLLEENRLPLKGEIFARKEEVGAALERLRTQQRQNAGTVSAQGERRVPYRARYWWAAAAVAILLVVGGYFVSQKKLMATDQVVACSLPDGSRVQLKEHSALAYNRIGWMWNRELRLSGKAFFEVAHGGKFRVRTEAGDITVHGTKFLVEQEGDNMFVDCQEGKVEVKTKSGKQVLEAGEHVRCVEHQIGEVKKDVEYPPVLNYEHDPLVNVIADIEQIFHIDIVGMENGDTLTYEGSISTTDLKSTLQEVFGSLHLKYQVKGSVVEIGD